MAPDATEERHCTCCRLSELEHACTVAKCCVQRAVVVCVRIQDCESEARLYLEAMVDREYIM